MRMRSLSAVGGVLWVLACLVGPARGGAGEIVTVTDGFAHGTARWRFLDASHWKIGGEDANPYLVLDKPGKQRPPVRRPGQYALMKGGAWRDVIIEARVKSLRPSAFNGRDVCILFGFVDDTHFYYTHLCSDSNGKTHNVIMKVEGSKRMVIMREKRPSPRLTDGWHRVRVTHRASGEIAVYMNDFEVPLMTASDTSYPAGMVGVGSFDDRAAFDDIRIGGTLLGTD